MLKAYQNNIHIITLYNQTSENAILGMGELLFQKQAFQKPYGICSQNISLKSFCHS